MVLNGTFLQEYPVKSGGLQTSILGPILSLLYFSDLLDDIICNNVICNDDTTLCSKFDQASNLWKQLEWAFALESDVQDTVD